MALTLQITAKTLVKAGQPSVELTQDHRVSHETMRTYRKLNPPLTQSRITVDLQTLTGVLGKICGLTLSPQRCAQEKFVAVQIELWKRSGAGIHSVKDSSG